MGRFFFYALFSSYSYWRGHWLPGPPDWLPEESPCGCGTQPELGSLVWSLDWSRVWSLVCALVCSMVWVHVWSVVCVRVWSLVCVRVWSAACEPAPDACD